MLSRIEREKQLQLENYSIRLQAAETEANNLREEVARQRNRLEKVESERGQLMEQLEELKNELNSTKNAENKFKEKEKRLVTINYHAVLLSFQ